MVSKHYHADLKHRVTNVRFVLILKTDRKTYQMSKKDPIAKTTKWLLKKQIW